jgi:integrase/recombinase XerD
MVSTFEKMMTRPSAIARHRAAPLAKEREVFLNHLSASGLSPYSVRTTASSLLQVVKLLRLRRLRDVSSAEVDRASEQWVRRRFIYHNTQPGPFSKRSFGLMARRWLRFLGRFQEFRPPQPFKRLLSTFVEAMTVSMGFSETTIRNGTFRARSFLNWFAKRRRRFRTITIEDIDSYLFRRPSSPALKTIATECLVLRTFFRYAESRKWCNAGIAASIKAPIIRANPNEVHGPKWADVMCLLRATRGPSRNETRAHALLQIFAIYGLRASEAGRLQLSDIDWTNQIFTVRRGKHGGLQQFPLQEVVGQAIRRYIDEIRPECSCQNVFVTLFRPYRPLTQPVISAIVHSRMSRLKIESWQSGPHALRHACATRLLSLGASYSEIADFLGHRTDRTVQIYAKLDIRRLREVSKLDLLGAL